MGSPHQRRLRHGRWKGHPSPGTAAGRGQRPGLRWKNGGEEGNLDESIYYILYIDVYRLIKGLSFFALERELRRS